MIEEQNLKISIPESCGQWTPCQWGGSFDGWRLIVSNFDGWRLNFRAFDGY